MSDVPPSEGDGDGGFEKTWMGEIDMVSLPYYPS